MEIKTNVILFTFSIPLHSLHGCHKPLNINTSPCNVLVFHMSLMSLDCKVTSVTWHFCLSLHGEGLKIKELQHSCNE